MDERSVWRAAPAASPVVVGCGVLVAVRGSVCDGTGTVAGVVVILAVFVRVLLCCCPAGPMTPA